MSTRTDGAPLLHAGLARLAARRTLALSFLALVAAVLALALTHDWSLAPSVVTDAHTHELVAGRMRQGIWVVALLFSAPLLVHRASRAAAAWRRSEADWVAPLPLTRASWMLSTLLGTLAAGALVCVVVAAAVELRAPGAEDAWRWSGALANPGFVLAEGDAARSWEQPELARVGGHGARLWVRATALPGEGPTARVRFAAARAGAAGGSVEATVAGAARIALDLPAGEGAVTLSLERLGPGAMVVLPPRAVELVLPAASERLASLELLLRALLGLAAASSIAFGLAAWMRAGLATATVAALATLPLLSAVGTRLLPGGDLALAWSLVGEGFVPPPLGVAPVALCALSVASGAALALAGIRRGRSAG